MEASAWTGVQGRTVAKGVIRDRSEAEARTEQDQFRDASDFAKHMGELTLTERTWNRDEAAAKLEQVVENGTQLGEDENGGENV
jgi:hypothetical protein